MIEIEFPVVDHEALIAEYENTIGRTITGATRRLMCEYTEFANKAYYKGWHDGFDAARIVDAARIAKARDGK